jgi:5-methylcytosine-specific restriction enzyme A
MGRSIHSGPAEWPTYQRFPSTLYRLGLGTRRTASASHVRSLLACQSWKSESPSGSWWWPNVRFLQPTLAGSFDGQACGRGYGQCRWIINLGPKLYARYPVAMPNLSRHVRFWIVKGKPSRNDFDELLEPNIAQTWITKKPPNEWASGDIVFFWASGTAKRVVGLGRIVDLPSDLDDADYTRFTLESLTGPLEYPLGIEMLRGDVVLSEASFLKAGPAGTIFPLTPEQGAKLATLVASNNPRCIPILEDHLLVTASSTFTADEYITAFRGITISPHHLRMLQAHYYSPDQALTATQMSRALGYSDYRSANLHYGRLGRLVGEKLAWKPLPTQTVGVLCTFEKPEREWHWIMRPAVARALEQLGWVEEAVDSKIPEEIESTEALYEGAVKTISINAYERNAVAREKCISHYGCSCAACGLTLAERYGEIAQGMIHVHHVRQLSEVGVEYQVDPIRDLRPVCPTCHAVIHVRTPPLTVDEVRAMIEKQKEGETLSV